MSAVGIKNVDNRLRNARTIRVINHNSKSYTMSTDGFHSLYYAEEFDISEF